MVRDDINAIHSVLPEHTWEEVLSDLVLVKCCTKRCYFLVWEVSLYLTSKQRPSCTGWLYSMWLSVQMITSIACAYLVFGVAGI